MMEISQISPRSSETLSTVPKARLNSDFDTFLRMLTAQMKNQDPLNPVESADFATQLATFSGVEQAVMTNDLLRALTSQMSVAGLGDMAPWVGKEVRAAVPAYFSGQPVTLFPDPVALAQSGEIVVRDANGREVQRIAVPATEEPLQWNGIDQNGNALPNGIYEFTFVSVADGQPIGATPIDVYSKVTEIRSGPSGVELITNGGITVAVSNVKALREYAGG